MPEAFDGGCVDAVGVLEGPRLPLAESYEPPNSTAEMTTSMT